MNKQAIVEANYMTKVLEILKNPGSNKTEALIKIRQLIADSQVRTFETFFRFLYDSLDEFAPNDIASGILIIAEAQFQDAHIVDSEIGVCAMIAKLLNEL